jgi:zinc protease
LIIEAAFEEEQASHAITKLLEMLEQLIAKPVDEAELNVSKRTFRARLERKLHSNYGLAQLAANAFAMGGTLTRLQSLSDRLAAVTPADVQRVARKYLRPRDVEIGVAGSVELLQAVSFLGSTETYRVERQ